jgi:microcystin degradation protein MlrC
MPEEQIRIAVGGISHETNTFTRVWSDYGDFRILRGDAILEDRFGTLRPIEGVELVPCYFARTVPGGLVRKNGYLQLRDELLQELRAALPVNGILLRLHGAMEVEEIGDGETDIVAAVRELAGPEVLISVSLDLHANVSPALVEHSDLITALRTAPHRDGPETRQRAFALLVHALRKRIRPVSAFVRAPLILAGESAVTEIEPARSLYARLEQIEQVEGIVDASLLIGCAWTDSPFTSTGVIVVADQDRELAARHATRLALQIWERRHEFDFDMETASIDESIQRAMSAPERPVFISDSGDNVTAGAAGDTALFAERLVALGARDAVVAGVADPEAVSRCAEAGIGAEVQLSIGGKLDPVTCSPFETTARVEFLSPDAQAAELAVVRVDGVAIVLTQERRVFADRASIAAAGIDPMEQQIVVVKLGYLFPDLRDNVPRGIMALSPGTSDLRLERLSYERLQRPIFPLDEPFPWEP